MALNMVLVLFVQGHRVHEGEVVRDLRRERQPVPELHAGHAGANRLRDPVAGKPHSPVETGARCDGENARDFGKAFIAALRQRAIR